MSYRYTTFAGYALPAQDPTHELGPGEHASPLISLPGGGLYDPWGSERVRPGVRRLRVEGLLTAATQAVLLAAYTDLRALVGTRNTLTRVSDDGLQTHTITARLQTMETARTAEWELQVPIQLEFALLAPVWSGTARAVVLNLYSTFPLGNVTGTLTNAGNAPVTDVTLTVLTSGMALSNCSFRISQGGKLYWPTWAGTLAAGQTLVVDCGARAVTAAGVDAYSGFSLGAGHNSPDWLGLAAGANAYTLYSNSYGGTATISYSDGWV